jgi:trk system potassium uptake protein
MKLINPLIILRILSTVLFITVISFVLCLPVVFIYRESPQPFILSGIIAFISSILFYAISYKADINKFSSRDGYIAVILSWIMISLLGTLPYLISGTIPSFVDAFFESTSGFSTTGSSILTNVESLPHSILFWRSLTQWIGGIGIIVLLIIILPSMKVTGYQFFSLESSLKEKFHPKTKAIGIRMVIIYLGLTIAEIILLNIGDMNLFDSICHSFSTIATGGFSTKNTSLMSFSAYSQYIVMGFMFLAGTNQIIFYYLLKFNFKKIRQNEELWFFLIVVIITGAFVASILLTGTGMSLEESIRNGFFQVISIISCTGLISSNFTLWPVTAVLLIFILMFAGGCTGSSSGGIRMARHLIVLKNIKNIFVKLNHPNSVSFIKLNGKSVNENANISILSFVLLYLFIFIVGTVVIIITGTDLISASTSVATCMAGIGPGLGNLAMPGGFSVLPGISKIVLSLMMIVGRLEIITVFVIFTRTFWKL